jgi:hypothetical protein
MNLGMRGLPTQVAQVPRGLLGAPTPIPMPDQAWHVEAVDWRARVIRNGGSVSYATTKAVSIFCTAIDGAGLRDRFYRLNLFCGNGLSSALVPLYRGPVAGGTALGNATDTNSNFVSADYNETGNACGLNGNGTNKYLNTGLNASAFSSFRNLHMGIGLRKTTTGTGFKMALGAFRYSPSTLEWSIKVRRGDANVPGNCMFGNFNLSSNTCGDSVSGAALRTGNIIASWPTMTRKGDRSGVAATAGQNITGSVPFYVFAMVDSDPSALGVVDFSDIRLDWYSLGAEMSESQSGAFNSILAEFQTNLNRS